MITPAVAPTLIPAVAPGLVCDEVDCTAADSEAVDRGGLVESKLVMAAVGRVATAPVVLAPVSFAVLVGFPVAVGVFGSYVVSRVDQRWHTSLDDLP